MENPEARPGRRPHHRVGNQRRRRLGGWVWTAGRALQGWPLADPRHGSAQRRHELPRWNRRWAGQRVRRRRERRRPLRRQPVAHPLDPRWQLRQRRHHAVGWTRCDVWRLRGRRAAAGRRSQWPGVHRRWRRRRRSPAHRRRSERRTVRDLRPRTAPGPRQRSHDRAHLRQVRLRRVAANAHTVVTHTSEGLCVLQDGSWSVFPTAGFPTAG